MENVFIFNLETVCGREIKYGFQLAHIFKNIAAANKLLAKWVLTKNSADTQKV